MQMDATGRRWAACAFKGEGHLENMALGDHRNVGTYEETTSVTLLICSLRLGVGHAGQGWFLHVACAESRV